MHIISEQNIVARRSMKVTSTENMLVARLEMQTMSENMLAARHKIRQFLQTCYLQGKTCRLLLKKP